MRDTMVLDPFRTPILMTHWRDSEQMNDQLQAVIRARRYGSAGVQGSNRGGWHSEVGFEEWDEPCVKELFRRAQEMSEVFVDEIMQLPADTYRFAWRFSAWAVVNERGDYNVPHNHPTASWSGVYYVRAEPPLPDKPQSGCIEFRDPRSGICAARPAAMYGHTWHRVVPRPGLMLIFPSWLTHFVHPYAGDSERIVVSFDAVLTHEGYDFERIVQAKSTGRLGRRIAPRLGRPPEAEEHADPGASLV
jgi:uncharacterized protein (TIGR02466 family)